MKLYRDGQVVDVQPKHVGRYEAAGWSRTPQSTKKSARRTARAEQPAEPAGDVSTDEGDR